MHITYAKDDGQSMHACIYISCPGHENCKHAYYSSAAHLLIMAKTILLRLSELCSLNQVDMHDSKSLKLLKLRGKDAV